MKFTTTTFITLAAALATVSAFQVDMHKDKSCGGSSQHTERSKDCDKCVSPPGSSPTSLLC